MWVLRLSLAVLVLGLAAPGGASAAPGWVSPVTVGTSVFGDPRVAAAPDGTVTVVWEGQHLAGIGVLAATRPPGGTFTAPAVLSSSSVDNTSLVVATSRSGYVVAAWRQGGANPRATAAIKPPGQAWTNGQALSDINQVASSVTAAMSPTGEATVTWALGGRVQAARRPPGSGWTQAEDVSEFGVTASEPRVATASNSRTTAIWLQNGQVTRADRPAGGSWTTGVPLSASGAQAPALAAGSGGHLAAVWLRSGQAEATVRAPSGAWAPPKLIGTHSVFGDPPVIAINGQGTARALWVSDIGTGIATASGTSAGWTPEAPLVRAGFSDAYRPSIAASRAGHFIGAWPGEKGSTTSADVQAATRLPGAAWTTVQGLATIPSPRAYPAVSMDDQGNGVAVWPQWGVGVRVRGHDAAGPDLLNLHAPSGLVGKTLAFSVTPRDRWSPVATTSWTFGDGRGATGPSVSHAFGTAGTYVVTVTSTDALGNATTARRTITVTSALVDTDGDSVPDSLDCADNDPRRFPGNPEVPGNRIDENCDGKKLRPPARFTVIPWSGGYSLPSGLECTGKVKLKLKRAGKVLQRRSVRLNRRCRFETSFRVKRTKLRRAKRLTVVQSYKGRTDSYGLRRNADGTYRRT
jgi:hypothetical protein